MVGVLLIAAAAAGSLSSPTLGEWAARSEQERRIVLVGSVEGVLLATSAVNGAAVPVNTNCFSTVSPEEFDRQLLLKAKSTPSVPLAQALITLPSCKVAK